MENEIKFNQIKGIINKSFAITDQNVYNIYKKYLPSDIFVLPCGESTKSLQTLQVLVRQMLKSGINRKDCIFGVGGGVVGDICGFVASIYMRGIKYCLIPTTVTALADSSIGGKTALNCDSKNIIGTFCLPKAVFRCFDFLSSLSKIELASGMAEVFKMALLNKSFFEMADSLVNLGLDNIFNDVNILKQMIKKAIIFKEQIVKNDFLDNGQRKNLNIGHTIGHAIEYAHGFSHGICVMIGLYVEALMCNICDMSTLSFIKNLVNHYSLYLPFNKIDLKKVMIYAKNDKKNQTKLSVMAVKSTGQVKQILFTEQEFEERLNQAFKTILLN